MTAGASLLLCCVPAHTLCDVDIYNPFDLELSQSPNKTLVSSDF